jgi:hypothetical protein
VSVVETIVSVVDQTVTVLEATDTVVETTVSVVDAIDTAVDQTVRVFAPRLAFFGESEALALAEGSLVREKASIAPATTSCPSQIGSRRRSADRVAAPSSPLTYRNAQPPDLAPRPGADLEGDVGAI